MHKERLMIFAYLIPILLIILFVISIILLVNHKKIVAKYNVGYISSFFFTAYMLTPLTLGIPSLLSNTEDKIFTLLLSLLYPLIGSIFFMIIFRKYTLKYKLGKFFAMLALGICSGYMFIFKLLGLIHFFESRSSNFKKTAHNSEPIPNIQTESDIFRGRINEYREIYDYGGNLLARINDNGDIIYPNGEYYAHIDYAGDVYDAGGKYLGRIKNDGEIQNADWEYTGKLNND